MRWRWLFWGLALSAFFVSTLFMSWPLSRELFVSPDENAAYTFAKTLSETGSLFIPEPLNEELGGILHPRSTIGFGDGILPASFVGYIVFLGVVGAVLGKATMFLMTPLLAVLTVLLWRDLAKRMFDNELLANLAAVFLMIHPAFWYYSGRVMMHNIAFLFLLIAGAWWLVRQPLWQWANKQPRPTARLVDFGIAGLLFGASLIIRTSEALWVIVALAVVFILYRAVIGWRATVTFGLGFALAIGLLATLNASVYGGPLVNGYTVKYPFTEISISAQSTSDSATAPLGTNLLLPFGFHEQNILESVLNYGWKLYPWMSALALAGLVIVFVEKDEQRKLWRGIAVLTLILAAWLGIVYGSWRIIDNPDPSIISLGNSHVRYWLPLFALASLFSAKTIVFMLHTKTWWRQMYAYGLVLLATLLSLQLVMFGQDGFAPNQVALASFELKRERILSQTEVNAIMVVDRADKYVFPARRVVTPLRSEVTYMSLPRMLEYAPVYYFGITLPDTDMEYLNSVKLLPLGVRIEYVEIINEESLYRFVKN